MPSCGQVGLSARAVSVLAEVLTLAPGDIEASVTLADAHLALGAMEQAAAVTWTTELSRQLFAGDEAAAGAWNFGPDNENVRPVQELAETAVTVWGSGEVRIERDPDAPHEATLLMLDSGKAKNELGWRPRWDFATGVTRAVEWYKGLDDGLNPIDLCRQQIAEYGKAGE